MCCRVAQWLVFSDVWNAIVDELRTVDLISDGEQRNLSFVHLPIDDSIQVPLHPLRLGQRHARHCISFLRGEGLSAWSPGRGAGCQLLICSANS